MSLAPPKPRENTSLLAAPLDFDDLALGMTACLTRRVTEKDIVAFSDVSGDRNPVHLDADYAAQSFFGERIAHGMLSASFISAVLGTQLPGPGAIYLEQSLEFLRPVRIGDEVEAEVTVTALEHSRRRVVCATICRVDGQAVIAGEATLKVARAKRPRAPSPPVHGALAQA